MPHRLAGLLVDELDMDRPDGVDPDGAGAQHERFMALYSSNYRSIYGLLLTLVGDPNHADDLVQQTSLLLWREFATFDPGEAAPEEAFGRWARSIARNVAHKFHALRRKRHVALDDNVLAKLAMTRVAADELLEIRKQALKSCLEKLPPTQRRLLRVCYANNCTITAAASELGRPRNAIYKALRRIRLQLFRCINQTLGLEDGHD